jgi:hypothetical protein
MVFAIVAFVFLAIGAYFIALFFMGGALLWGTHKSRQVRQAANDAETARAVRRGHAARAKFIAERGMTPEAYAASVRQQRS